MIGAVALVALMLPALSGFFAGSKVVALRSEQTRLINERTALDLQEAKILSPQHLQELADKQSFVDPDPQRIVYLESKPDGAVAKRLVASKELVR